METWFLLSSYFWLMSVDYYLQILMQAFSSYSQLWNRMK